MLFLPSAMAVQDKPSLYHSLWCTRSRLSPDSVEHHRDFCPGYKYRNARFISDGYSKCPYIYQKVFAHLNVRTAPQSMLNTDRHMPSRMGSPQSQQDSFIGQRSSKSSKQRFGVDTEHAPLHSFIGRTAQTRTSRIRRRNARTIMSSCAS